MLFRGCSAWDAVSGMLYPGCCIWDADAVSRMLYPECCILDAVSEMRYLVFRIWDAVSNMMKMKALKASTLVLLGLFSFGALLCVPSQAVHEIINQALEKLEEMQVPMPDYALKSAGAAVIQSRTSPSLRTAKAKVFLYSLPVMDYMRSPELILEPDNHPGNCWPFPGSQGRVFIKLSMPVIPRAVTMAHVSGTAFHGESISRAPKDFAVYGFKEEHEEQGMFLGQFTFLATWNPSQTFQLKLGYSIWDADSGMLYLGRCIWNAVSGILYLGSCIYYGISGLAVFFVRLELVIPPKVNVFYTMTTQANLDFTLRRKASAMAQVQRRSLGSPAAPRPCKLGVLEVQESPMVRETQAQGGEQ
ncbi:hypothetical protein Q9966_014848 [Columba livia]|nr:hypothetical protein Q9966_014848 [Columba livia]